MCFTHFTEKRVLETHINFTLASFIDLSNKLFASVNNTTSKYKNCVQFQGDVNKASFKKKLIESIDGTHVFLGESGPCCLARAVIQNWLYYMC